MPAVAGGRLVPENPSAVETECLVIEYAPSDPANEPPKL